MGPATKIGAGAVPIYGCADDWDCVGPRYAFVGRSIGLHPVCCDLCFGFDFLCADPAVHFTDTAFEATKPMRLMELIRVSPLGSVGMFLLGGIFAAQFGMAAIYGSQIGLSLSEISAFVASFYVGAMLLQYPIGWVSDRMDRRFLIVICARLGAASLLAILTAATIMHFWLRRSLLGACPIRCIPC